MTFIRMINRALLVLWAIGFLAAPSQASAQGSARDGTRDTVNCGAGRDRIQCGSGRDRATADRRVKGKPKKDGKAGISLNFQEIKVDYNEARKPKGQKGRIFDRWGNR